MQETPESALTFDDALLELRVDAKASADEIRRAYLRLVKTRSPERDPIGFRRARACYEVARNTLAMRELAARQVPAKAGADEPAPLPGTEPASAAAPEAAAIEPPPAPTPAAIASLSPEQQATLALVKRAWEIRDLSDWKVLVEAIEAATRWLDGPPVPVPACLFFIVALIGQEEIPTALEIRRALGKWLDARQDAARMLTTDLAVRWLVAQELCAVAPEITVPAAAALAKAILAGDLTQARDALAVATVVSSGPTIGNFFQQYAPHLIAALPASSVPRVQRRRTAQTSKSPIWVVIPLVIFGVRVLSGLDSCASNSLSTTPDPSPIDPRPFVPSNLPPPLPTNNGRLELTPPSLLGSGSQSAAELPRWSGALSQDADALAREADKLGLTRLAAAARALDDKWQSHGCAAAQPAIHAMKRDIDQAHDRALRAAYRELAGAADHECSSHEPAADPTP